MMARQVARQFFGLREAHSEGWAPNKPEKWLLLVAASTRAGLQSRLIIIWVKHAKGFCVPFYGA